MQMRSVLYSDLPGWDAASRGQTGLENAALGGLRVPPTPFLLLRLDSSKRVRGETVPRSLSTSCFLIMQCCELGARGARCMP